MVLREREREMRRGIATARDLVSLLGFGGSLIHVDSGTLNTYVYQEGHSPSSLLVGHGQRRDERPSLSH